MKKTNQILINTLIYLGVIAVILAVYSLLAVIINSSFILPPLSEVLVSFFLLFTKSNFYISLLNTLLRTVIAFFICFILAFILALACYKNKRANAVISPLISVIRALPTLAVILLIVIWTNSFIAPIIVTSLVVLPTVFQQFKNALLEIDKDQIEMCKLFNVGKNKIYKKVILPSLAPSTFSVIGTGLSLNLKLMVAGEVLSATSKSLGNMLNVANVNLQMAEMLGIIVVSVILSLSFELIFELIKKRVVKWL